MITLIFILTCYGICNSLIYGSVFEGFRTFLSKFGVGGYSLFKLFTCFICLGTWVGFGVSAILAHFGHLNVTPWGSQGIENVYLIVFLNGLLSSAGVWLINTIQDFMERAFIK